MKHPRKSARAAVLQSPLLKKNHAHEVTHKQQRKAIRRKLAQRQWDDRSAKAQVSPALR
jgi:hypothetical protein